MGGFGPLILAVTAFLASHSLPAIRPLRRILTRLLGERGYLAAYSLLSIIVIAWIGVAYARAPYLELWPQVGWTRWVPLLVMPFVAILVVAGLTSPNPFSIGSGGKGFDPAHPGILRLTRHPLFAGLMLWAAAHLFPNGDLAAVILFGLLLALAAAGPKLLDAKRRRSLGPARWAELAAHTGRGRLALGEIGIARILGGLALYGLLLFLHPYVFGVSPLPL